MDAWKTSAGAFMRDRPSSSTALTFTCQECGKFSTDRTDFKKIGVQTGPLRFAYILCNEHAKKHQGDDQ